MADSILKFLAAFESRTKLLGPFSAEFGNLVSKSLVHLNLDFVSNSRKSWNGVLGVLKELEDGWSDFKVFGNIRK